MTTLSPHRRWIGFLALCTGMFLAILDIQIVVTSLAVIQDALSIGAENMSWIQTAYIIAEVIAIPLTGLLIRVLSMRWLFVWATVVFLIASAGCAASTGFATLLAWRVLQGFAGGVLIPLVFTAIFLMFGNGREQSLATTVGGLLAVLAPAIGPLAGGWITESFSWHWLFLINILPGIVAIAAGAFTLPASQPDFSLLRRLDWLSLAAIGLGLAAIVIGLKEAPGRGWFSAPVIGCLAAAAALIAAAIWRPHPAIPFHLLKDRAMAYGTALSFLLGFSLFSTVYLLPVFFAIVRGYGPLTVGIITAVMGAAQIVSAPLTVQIDRRFDARWLSALGFAGLAIGLAMNANLTVSSDYDDVFWPQIVRGAFIALCILPPIRLAMALMPKDDVGDASGLFNLARNMGGVTGIAATDSVMFGRAPAHAETIQQWLSTDPAQAAAVLGLTIDDLPAPDDAFGLINLIDQIQAASLTMAINEAWWLLAASALLALPLLALVGPVPSAKAHPQTHG